MFFLPPHWQQLVRYLPVLLALLLSCFLLSLAVLTGQSILLPMIASWLAFAMALRRLNFTVDEILRMSKAGLRASLKVIQIFVFIGLMVSLWQAAGTLPAIISYSLSLITPGAFLILAFLLTTLVSMLTGTSLGTVGTIGLALITLARVGNVPLDLTAGAIMSGAYVGDRNSPMSSSAILIATLTQTKVPDNVRRMFKSSIPALLLSTLLYGGLSFFYPLQNADQTLVDEIHQAFVINPWLLTPALLMLALVLARISIKYAMSASTLLAIGLALYFQHTPWIDLLRYAVFGFAMPENSPLAHILRGGGLLSMVTPSLVVGIACALSSMIEEAGLLQLFQQKLLALRRRSHLFAVNVLCSLLTGAIGCSQSVAIVMTYYLLRVVYAKSYVTAEDMAIDFENAPIVLSPLIPWNIAAIVPTVMLGVTMTGYIPYAFFLYLLPLTYGVMLHRQRI